jgi:hypothetical protein
MYTVASGTWALNAIRLFGKRLQSRLMKIVRIVSSILYLSFIPVYGHMVSGFRCQDSIPKRSTLTPETFCKSRQMGDKNLSPSESILK